jgi:hypothetical protein
VDANEKVEPTIGIEPMNLFLTKEALYRLSYVGICLHSDVFSTYRPCGHPGRNVERETRLELATFSLEG